MTVLDHLEIGTLSFALCDGEMVLEPRERVRLILAAAEAYDPTLLVTAGHAVHTHEQLHALAAEYAELECTGTIITEVHHDQLEPSEEETHAMYAITSDGQLHAFGRQVFAYSREVEQELALLESFDAELPQRTLALPDWNVFALICGELNVLRGRDAPAWRSTAAEQAVMAADVVINPTHDRMSNAGTLHAKRRLLSKASDDGRERVYVGCANWEACGTDKGRRQHPSPTLHTVYVSGEPVEGEQHADGAFGFVYRHWELDL